MLYAGKFRKPPARLAILKYRKVMFLDEDGRSCWVDPNHREVVNSMDEAVTVLRAHRYEVDPESLIVVPVLPPAVPQPPLQEESREEPREKPYTPPKRPRLLLPEIDPEHDSERDSEFEPESIRHGRLPVVARPKKSKR